MANTTNHPLKHGDRALEATLYLRITREDRELVDAGAKASGQTITDYILGLVRSDRRGQRNVQKYDFHTSGDMNKSISRYE